MRRMRQGLALLLALLLAVSALPAALAAEETMETQEVETQAEDAAEVQEAETEEPAGEVAYSTEGEAVVTVTVDPGKAGTSDGEGNPYVLFEEDGGYTIPLPSWTEFPIAVDFVVGEQEFRTVFGNEAETNEVGGHVFRVRLEAAPEPESEETLYVTVGGRRVDLVPEESAPLSMLPLEERWYNLDLSSYFPDELRAVDISAMLDKLAERYANVTGNPDQVSAWAKWSYYNEEGDYVGQNDNYTIVGSEKTLDLSQGGLNSSRQLTLELIIGRADPLNQNNIRYMIQVKTLYLRDLLTFVGLNGVRINRSYYNASSSSWIGKAEMQLNIDGDTWDGKSPFSVKMETGSLSGGISWRACEGYHETLEQAQAAPDITAELKTSGYEGDFARKQDFSQMPSVTVVFERSGSAGMVMPFCIRAYKSSDSVQLEYQLYRKSGTSYEDRVAENISWVTGADGVRTGIYEMSDASFPADGTYYAAAYYMHNGSQVGAGNIRTYVEKTVVGRFTSADQAAGEDITSQLFGGGYPANYSGGVTFTVILKNGTLKHLAAKTTGKQLPDAPEPLSEDTYFRVNGAKQGGRSLNAYAMPYDADSYYYNGFQTVLLLDGEGNAVSGEIAPTFWSGGKVDVFAGLDMDGQMAGAQKQISGESRITFTNGAAVPYSAAAENGRNLKNYWVTFLTRQPGKALFVNGVNDESRRDEETGYPVREVFLTDEYDHHHDIFFANVGSEQLTNLNVELLEAENVRLDDYWQIGQTKTLAPFTTTREGSSYGELWNVSKIRLVPVMKDGVAQAGVVSGTLKFSADGVEPIYIKLTGVAGAPKITTDSIWDGVKFVHYSCLIQTNNMYGSDAVKFTRTGSLPSGVNLKENGELYGVPKETGTFTFTVKAVYNNDPSMSDSKEFTLTILPNTDKNVLDTNSGAQGYPLEENGAIPDQSGTLKDQVFHSTGEFSEFMNFYLDGKELTPGTDYTAESGSTKITVRAQTFKNAGNGSHTISAEFRTGASYNGVMHSTAQNFTLSGIAGGSTGGSAGGSSGSSGGSGSSSTGKKPETQKPAPKPVPDTKPTVADVMRDIDPGQWFFPDVDWAYQKGLMVGVTGSTYQPYGSISPATVVVVLARLNGTDLSPWAEKAAEGVKPGEWYSAAASWARESGLLPEGPFEAAAPMSRGQMAVMLLKYLKHLGIDCTLPAKPVEFRDAVLMTGEENGAFQALYQFGIFKGVGNATMDVAGFTTRAQFAVLLHRLSVFVGE